MDFSALNNDGTPQHLNFDKELIELVQGTLQGITFIEITGLGLKIVPVQATIAGNPFIVYESLNFVRWAELSALANEIEGGRSKDHFPSFNSESPIMQKLAGLLEPPAVIIPYKFVILQNSEDQAKAKIVESFISKRGHEVKHYKLSAASIEAYPGIQEHVLSVIGTLPLRNDYILIMSSIEPLSRRVILRPHILYKAGDTSLKQQYSSAEIVSACRDEQVFLAIISKRESSLKQLEEPHLIACNTINLPATQRCCLKTRLIAPGLLEITTDSHEFEIIASDVRLKDMLSQIPTVVERPETRYIDVVFLIDTICSPDLLEKRREFIESALKEAQQEIHPDGQLRVGAIAYGAGHFPANKKRLTYRVHTLTDELPRIEKFLQSIKPIEGNRFEAAFEDALEALYHFNWERDHRRVAVVVGNRPPYPFIREHIGQQHSPLHYDWRILLTGLRNYYRLNFISVVCPIFWSRLDKSRNEYIPAPSLPEYAEEYAIECWREVGYTGAFKFEQISAVELARMIVTTLKKETPTLRVPVQPEPQP